jgi:hypothetical protein
MFFFKKKENTLATTSRENSHNTISENQEFQNTTQKTDVAKIPLLFQFFMSKYHFR